MTDPTAILALYGTSHLDWLGPCLESLVDPGGVSTVILVTDRPAPRSLFDWAAVRKVSLATVPVDADAGSKMVFAMLAESPVLRREAKIPAWKSAFHLLTPMTQFVCLDLDVLVLRPLRELFREATPASFHLAMPRTLRLATGRPEHQTAVCAGVAGPQIPYEFEAWVREIRRLGHQRETIVDLYGSLAGGAWQQLVVRSDDGGGALVARLPETWGAVTPLPHAGILHFGGKAPQVEDPAWNGIAQAWWTARSRWRQYTGIAR